MRLALCGNVFPADNAAEVLAQLRGPVSAWAKRFTAQNTDALPGFGLYLSAVAAAEFRAKANLQVDLADAISQAGVSVWTANAFPFGGFHGDVVKELAFTPDWRDRSRLQFTQDVAVVLAGLMPRGSRGSISTCPLGYGNAADSPVSWRHLHEAHDFLAELRERTGVTLVLAIEPEPDGAFERVGALAAAIGRHFPQGNQHIGICWDLCHSAVVGETPSEAISALLAHKIPQGKIQISSAMRLEGPLLPPAREVLSGLQNDPWFHQARAQDAAHGSKMQWPDLPQALADSCASDAILWRVHCHVPLHLDQLNGGWQTTPWHAAVEQATAAGMSDFEFETYTLPHLLGKVGQEERLVETLFAESQACARVLGFLPVGD
ncbi:MAG: metabolite traffic protein EboE [Planctomycetes bacterium]|nr:metabolite traffic protein EboE [Planctomycetota bacterium]MBT4028831.1 metabolite traffic protein EboE [Planctomycetota bacterium]MBT4559609.1 metabolite traffic protein EboE [Planctomycetota bacterium]MBT5120486.1 metabolite traffic protein EboE [Planctomycetota bacterium]MBT7318865.1 metabolite traffic protein EboE [Planctomycetota bacterium]